MLPSDKPYRFQVALSFAAEHRARVANIAETLADKLGKDKILYDSWYSAEFARPNLDTYLSNLYHSESQLLVFFLSGEHSQKEWCGLEWRVARDLLKKKHDSRLMLLRLDEAEIPDLLSIDGYLDVSEMPDAEVAQNILIRLATLTPLPSAQIDAIVGNLRDRIRPGILSRCGTIRVLTMERPIELGAVYTDVNLFEKRTANLRKTREELLKEASSGTVNRLGIPASDVKRVPGLDALAEHRHLIIYGKPGAGKTTFLKRLATECISGAFRPELVPAFVTLKDFAEADGSPGLITYIQQLWHGGQDFQTILSEGRALILLDGLDEVRDRDFGRVRSAIEALALESHRCLIALTCRIAAREYAFSRFTEVEMADFTKEQIEAFATRWFAKTNRSAVFLEKLSADKAVLELAQSPLLLTLLCLVFEERRDFQGTRAELYREGLDVLLRKWDAKRDIERDRPYGLSIADMEALLSEIAYRRYLNAEYLFDQTSLETQIEAFFAARSLLRPGEELVPERVLNSLESHVGVLVQQAMRVYSFSHLSFQEYLTAHRVAKKRTLLSEIGPKIRDRRWRDVWLLLVTMVDADEIIPDVKRYVDSVAGLDPEIRKFLDWCSRKAASQAGPYKTSALRAMYFDLERETEFPGVLRLWLKSFRLFLARTLDPRLIPILDSYSVPDSAVDINFAPELLLDLALYGALNGRFSGSLLDLGSREFDLRAAAAAFGISSKIAPSFFSALKELKDLVPSAARDSATRKRWAILPPEELVARVLAETFAKVDAPAPKPPEIGTAWIAGLRELAIVHRDIAHKWTWTPDQRTVLNDYYNSNLLLVECMKAARGLTNETRRRIEDGILLPDVTSS